MKKAIVLVIAVGLLLAITDCATPETTPAPDTTPAAITGLIATNAYDGRVNLRWDKSASADFDHYRIYASRSEIADTRGLTPVHRISDRATTRYQVGELDMETPFYFAVTAIVESGDENTEVAAVKVVSTPMPRGMADPEIQVDIYRSDIAWPGTTLLADNHNRDEPRIIEVNMLGEIIWEYRIPERLKQFTNPGFDVEWLPNNNILFTLPLNGVHEINRNGDTVWTYRDKKVSHDADRLPNGNTLVVFGGGDQIDDAQVKEISPEGEIIWSWYARDHFNRSPYKDVYNQGWTHTNAVTRLPSGNTLISPRNFDFLVEVDPQGTVVRTIGEGILRHQHDPEVLPGGNILLTNHRTPHRAVEIDPETGKIVWQSAGFREDNVPVRDANRLPNGNTLITGATEIV
ncbi:MAG: aryl-sulfate sulfotransferase [Chloroflexota bacterium]